jgi:S2P endopeptidase
MQFMEELLAYIASFSAGFALLNVVPCIAMDGQHIVTAIVELLPGNPISPTKQRLTQLSIYGGTVLVIINVICGLHNLLL